MEQSILKSTKIVNNVPMTDDSFDEAFINYINTAFFDLQQLGIGPVEGFAIENDTAVWDDFLVPSYQQNGVRTYVFLKVGLLFDPPTMSYLIDAKKEQLEEVAWRLNVNRENELRPYPAEVVL